MPTHSISFSTFGTLIYVESSYPRFQVGHFSIDKKCSPRNGAHGNLPKNAMHVDHFRTRAAILFDVFG